MKSNAKVCVIKTAGDFYSLGQTFHADIDG